MTTAKSTFVICMKNQVTDHFILVPRGLITCPAVWFCFRWKPNFKLFLQARGMLSIYDFTRKDLLLWQKIFQYWNHVTRLLEDQHLTHLDVWIYPLGKLMMRARMHLQNNVYIQCPIEKQLPFKRGSNKWISILPLDNHIHGVLNPNLGPHTNYLDWGFSYYFSALPTYYSTIYLNRISLLSSAPITSHH
jgi:hypothetical protein